jgi:hypothetical protein
MGFAQYGNRHQIYLSPANLIAEHGGAGLGVPEVRSGYGEV